MGIFLMSVLIRTHLHPGRGTALATYRLDMDKTLVSSTKLGMVVGEGDGC